MAKYKKDILKVGKITHPATGEKIDITDGYFDKLLENTLLKKHKPFVPFRHSKDPRDNTGFIDSFEIEDGVLYGNFDIASDVGEKYIDTGKIKQVSIGIDEYGTGGDYINHVALVSDPHLKDQNDFIQMEASTNFIYLSNNELTDWGGDTMSEEKISTLEKLNTALEFKATLKAENNTLKSTNLELENRVTSLETDLEKSNAKVLELEAADKERTDKLELEAKALEAEDRKAIYLEAAEAGKFKPADKDKIEGLGYTNDQLKGYFEGQNVEFNMENATVAENPNDVKPIDDPKNAAVVEAMRKEFTDEEITKQLEVI